jgi:hypothetical protein
VFVAITGCHLADREAVEIQAGELSKPKRVSGASRPLRLGVYANRR